MKGLVGALASHGGNSEDVAEYGLLVIKNLCWFDDDYRKLLGDAEVVEGE